MIVTMQGLYFETQSPSFYELSPAHYDMKGQSIQLAYLGGGTHDWYLLHVWHDTNDVKTQCFANRDQAVALIAQAFRNVGVM